MAGIITTKRRIKSAKNVSQITYAMQMVAASKMKKAQKAAVSGKPYADKIVEATHVFGQKIDRVTHPLLLVNSSPIKLVILISSDKGLCGGLNINLFKQVHRQFKEIEKTEYVTVGKKAEQFAVKSGRKLIADFSFGNLSQIAPALNQLVTELYVKQSAGEIYLAYNHFVSALKQEPTIRLLLPLPSMNSNSETFGEFVVEPSRDIVVDALLSAYIETQIRNALHQAQASEYSARVVTMKSATDSAKDLITGLTLEYNKLRQEKITAEISDIVTARLGTL